MKYSGWPEPGELVVGKVEAIEDFGVFVDLEEYEEKQGLVHISEVASGWIKNVRDHVREDQTVVCKVLDVDEETQQIDLSIKDVNDHQRKETIQRWKNEQKADKWMTLAFGEDLGTDEFNEIASVLLAAHGSLYQAFESAAIHGEAALEGTELDADAIETVVETARENVSVPYVEVTGYLTIRSPEADGVDVVKGVLKAVEGNGEVPDEIDLEVTYVGAPEYMVRVRAPNYKTAEAALDRSVERAESALAGQSGSVGFNRSRETEDE